MASLLHQLENNEAILLMYLADELAGEDRAEVEQMLATDAGLRAELERMRATYDSWTATMRDADRGLRPPVPESVAARRVAQEMRRRQAQPARVDAPEPRKAGLRYPWWAYPSASAAAVLLAFLVWWGNKEDESRYIVDTAERPQYPVTAGPARGPAEFEGGGGGGRGTGGNIYFPSEDDALASRLERSLVEAELQARAEPLEDVETEMLALSDAGGADELAELGTPDGIFFLLGDPNDATDAQP